ncbi:MAG: cytochrome d ubiquinol oxidase subunit II [Candidatus Hydrogenedens sp.]|nr:cytochrome d ubiquinol oxidase subunit II [Candidatus Hydrogenedens sp.]
MFGLDIHVIWFGLLGVLLAGYAILDGFDLGVGILHPLARTDRDRRIFLNSIGPLWDGNEVWLVTFGGAMFAAFPNTYATVFSGFYTAFMLLLCALIFRAVSIEFRSKRPELWWRSAWDYAFCAASGLAALLFGVAVGNAMQGIALNEKGDYTGTFLDLLGPYPLLVGAMTVALFAMHGSIYLYLKTEGDLQKRVYPTLWHTFGTFMVLYMFTTIFTLVQVPHAIGNFERLPAAWLIVLLNILAVANIPRAIFLKKPGYAFASSCCTVAALVSLFGIALFPNMVISSVAPEANSLTIYNAASSDKTLWIMFGIAVAGMPIVLAYTAIVYWTFRGKVELGKFSY